MKLKATEKLKLPYVKNIRTTASRLSNIRDSDSEIVFKKDFQTLNIKENLGLKNGVIIAIDSDTKLLNADKSKKIN